MPAPDRNSPAMPPDPGDDGTRDAVQCDDGTRDAIFKARNGVPRTVVLRKYDSVWGMAVEMMAIP